MIHVDRKKLSIPLNKRIIGHFGDNGVERLNFVVEDAVKTAAYNLYIEFPDGSINSINLPVENNVLVWNVKAEDIFVSGTAYLQIKAIGTSGEVWHSPQAAVEFLESIDENELSGERIPSLFEQLDEKVRELAEMTKLLSDSKDYITRSEAAEMIAESINTLLLPLDNRLNGI